MSSQPPPTPPEANPREMAQILRRNIESMRAQREREEARASWGERLAARISAFTGSLAFVAVHLVLVLGWVLVNLGLIPGVAPFDRTFVILATVASVEAIFLSTFVLMAQNRIATLADKRAALDLQINLLAEYEITRLVRLTSQIAARLEVPDAADPELHEITQEVQPEAVLEEIELEGDPGRPQRGRRSA